ncbi:MAG TPA: hypothetical protein VKT31_07430 [Solirubrobacteraceae bacterium]|nr:hypothetical protein [Solirubrobacteraceae bacterium]
MHRVEQDEELRTPRGRRRVATTEAQDPIVYRMAVGGIGVALIAFLIGGAVIAANGKPVPAEYWTAGGGLSGAIIGILCPSPKSATPTRRKSPAGAFFGAIADAISDLWMNRAVLLLLIIFGVTLGFSIANNSSQLETVAAAAGGALVGLLTPPPGDH